MPAASLPRQTLASVAQAIANDPMDEPWWRCVLTSTTAGDVVVGMVCRDHRQGAAPVEKSKLNTAACLIEMLDQSI